MIDPELVQMCADPRIEVEIVQQFVSEMNAADHLTVLVSQGNRTILVPKPETVEQAIQTTQEWVGKADVRVGLTQYPAGLGVTEASQIGYGLFDTCENLALGTELFGKVLRFVTERYGKTSEPAFEDAIVAYRTGWFDGERVFYTEDPDVEAMTLEGSTTPAEPAAGEAVQAESEAGPTEPSPNGHDPNAAPIRIDLSGIGAHNRENPSGE